MKTIIKKLAWWLEEHFFLLAALTTILGQGILIAREETLNYRQDNVGHIDKAYHQPLTRYLQGWNLKYFAGFNEDIYPNGYHYILKWFLEFFPELRAIQLMTGLIVVIQVLAVYLTAKTWYAEKTKRQLAFTAGLIVINLTSSDLVGTSMATIYAGTGPAGLGFGFFMIAMAVLKPEINSLFPALILGIVLGITLLTHPFSAMAILICIAIKFILAKKKSLEKWRLFEAGILGFLIGLPWIWTVTNPNFSGSRLNFSGDTVWGPIIFIGAAALLLQKGVRRRPLYLTALILALISSLPQVASDWLWHHGFAGWHFYRFEIFSLAILGISTVELVNYKNISRGIKWLGLAAVFFLIYRGSTRHIDIQVELDDQAVNQIKGRVLDLSSHPKDMTLGSWPNYALAKGKTAASAEGLFFESSELGILYYSLENLLLPQGYTLGIDLRILRKLFNVPRYQLDIDKAADLLGVNLYAFTLPENIENPQWPKDQVRMGKISEKFPGGYSIPVLVFVKTASSKPLIEPLGRLPGKTQQKFADWWPQASLDNLFWMPDGDDSQFNSFLPKLQTETEEIKISDISIGRKQITYQAEGVRKNQFAPVLAKFAYNRYFQAVSGGQRVPIFQVSPGFMLIPSANGPTKIYWDFPSSLKTIETASAGTLLLAATSVGIRAGIRLAAGKTKRWPS